MTTDQLEQRLKGIEAAVTDIRDKLDQLISGPNPKSRWWEQLGPPLSDDAAGLLDELAPRARYFRQTGEWPPPEWNPGDPIPEPEHWK